MARENTVASFRAAAAAGATWVELDARRTADDAVVVHHDPVTPDGGPLVARTAAALAALGVEALTDVLDGLPPGLGVDVELKNLPGQPDHDEDERLAAAVAGVLRPHVGTRPLLVSSFNPMTVSALVAHLPDVPAGLLHSDTLPVVSALEIALEVGAVVVGPHVDAVVGPAEVAAVHAAGCAVLVWTVDDPARARALVAAGVDALCTNDPAGLLRTLDRTPGRGASR